MIRFQNFKKRFKGSIDDVLDIPDLVLPGNVYWLKGSNGAGKTSLLKSIAGIVPFDGNISVDGLGINKNRMDYRTIVNYAEAEPAYPEFLRGTDLLELYKQTKKSTRGQVLSLVKRFGMSSYIDNKVGSYSSGMAKKLSLLLAFIGTPKLILLDEPFITLDPPSIKIVEELVAEFHSKGAMFIIASHQDFVIPSIGPLLTISLADKTISRQ